jgi:hypothetical protein
MVALTISNESFCNDIKVKTEEIPRIDYIKMLEVQPQENDKSTIWFDTFDGKEKLYSEKKGDLDSLIKFGSIGRSLKCQYTKGEKPGNGGVKIFFGDCPWGVKAREKEL